MPEETGPQALSGCLPAKACPEDHQIPTHAQGNYLPAHTLTQSHTLKCCRTVYTVRTLMFRLA